MGDLKGTFPKPWVPEHLVIGELGEWPDSVLFFFKPSVIQCNVYIWSNNAELVYEQAHQRVSVGKSPVVFSLNT